MWLKKMKSVYWGIRQRRLIRANYQANLEKNGREYAELYKRVEVLDWKKAPRKELQEAVEKKTDYILDHISRPCSGVIDRYSRAEVVPKDQGDRGTASPNIWVFWWTGEKDAPDLVRACINSIRLHANGHPVVVLDQNCYQNYIRLPDHVLKKHEIGLIGHAHFSDILRCALLATYGGVWIDATVFLSQPLPDSVFRDPFFSLRAYDPDAIYPSKSRWCTYFLAGRSGFPLFGFARDCLIEYWKEYDAAIDYLLFDYVILIGYRTLPSVRQAIDQVPDNNLYRMELMSKIVKPYSEEIFQTLCTSETFASKLSWRYNNLITATKSGEETNFGHFLKLYLPTD